MDYIAKCEICGKEYDSYHTTLYVQYSDNPNNRKCCCLDCIGEESKKKPYNFIKHLPMFCDGFDTTMNLFDTKDDIVNWIIKNYQRSSNEIICMDTDGKILIVTKDKKLWIVVGNTNLEKDTFPNWKDKVIELHGSL